MQEVLKQLLLMAGSAVISLASAWFKKKHDLGKLKSGEKVITDSLKIVDNPVLNNTTLGEADFNLEKK